MALTTAIIKTKLAAASRNTKDNVAQDIVTGATNVELKSLDAEGILRLFEALAMLPPRFYSTRDKAAVKSLFQHSQFRLTKKTPDAAVDTIKSARLSKAHVQTQLTPGLVTRIYAAETKRLSLLEKVGIDGSTIGRGQLGNPAYIDVKSAANFKRTWEKYLTNYRLAKILSKHAQNTGVAPGFNMSTCSVDVPATYSSVWRDKRLEDFVVAAYLAIKISAASKSGRSAKDTAKFAVAVYHGMFASVSASQKAVKDTINWAPVEKDLLSKGLKDEVGYVNEVVK